MADNANDEITKKILQSVKQLSPEEAARELESKLSDEDWAKLIQGRQAAAEAKAASQAGVKQAIEKSQLGSARSGFGEWVSGGPTTEQKVASYYDKLKRAAALDDVVKDIDVGAFQRKMAQEAALKKLGTSALKGGLKGLGALGLIDSLYGEIAPEDKEFDFEKLRKPKK
jgi:hypothetical protein